MFKYDLLRWLRSKKLVILLLVVSICSMTAILGTYYAKDIIDTFGTTGAEITIKKVSWQDVTATYFKMMSQIYLFISVYVIAKESQLGRSESESLFYKTRFNRGSKVLLSKLLTGFFISLITVIWGSLLAIYMTWAMYNNIDWRLVLLSILVEGVAFCSYTVIGLILSHYTSPFAVSFLIEMFVLFSGLLQNLKFFSKWLPTDLLIPNDILYQAGNIAYFPKIVVLAGGVILAVIFSYTIPFRKMK